MQHLLNLTVVIILLYIFYKLVGSYILPRWSDRQLQKYKQKFYSDNPHIDPAALDQRKKEQEENSSIIDRRRRLRKR